MATVSKHDPNLILAFKENLEIEVRNRVSHDITELLVAEYRMKVEKELQILVGNITIESLERIRDIASFRDEFKVYVKVIEQPAK